MNPFVFSRFAAVVGIVVAIVVGMPVAVHAEREDILRDAAGNYDGELSGKARCPGYPVIPLTTKATLHIPAGKGALLLKLGFRGKPVRLPVKTRRIVVRQGGKVVRYLGKTSLTDRQTRGLGDLGGHFKAIVTLGVSPSVKGYAKVAGDHEGHPVRVRGTFQSEDS